MDQPLVSIIMGIYNCEDTLEAAIQSIQNQTYSNWELIMCDDGSVDNTYRIAETYQRKDPNRFVLIKNKTNKGLNYTLNQCLKHAEGKYIARMDGDDLSKEMRIEKEVSFLESHPEYAIVSSKMEMFDEKGVWGETRVIERPQIQDFCLHSPFFCHAAVMVRAEAYKDVDGYSEDPRLLRVEDCHLWYKMYAKGYRGANIQEVLYSMRNDRNALSRRTTKARMNGIFVTWVGYRMIKMPWYNYIFLLRCVLLEFMKIIVPERLYVFLYKYKHGSSIQ